MRLDEVWAERPVAYLSISVPDFPNLFMLNGPNGPVGNFSLIEVAELQFSYILQLVEEVRSGRCRELGASASATERFDAERVEAAITDRSKILLLCSPGNPTGAVYREEDVRAVALDVLRHRVVLTYEAEAEEVTAEDVVRQVLNTIEVP